VTRDPLISKELAAMEASKVDLWTVHLTESCPACLSEDEALRANRFRFEEDRVRWTRARSSLRLILSGYVGEVAGKLCFEYGKHGKPSLLGRPEIQFNLSHSGDWAMIAVTRSTPVGVDVERTRSNVDMAALLRRLGESGLPESIPDLYQRWTRREAKSKAAGGPLFDTPPSDIYAVDVEAPAGYSGSVATAGTPPQVCYQRLY
jgi:4'-phosphopantetheinyl transferase